MATDSELLDAYCKGWMDQCHECTSPMPSKEEYTAYVFGRWAYMAGDDVKAIDAWTDEEILRQIHQQLKEQ